MNVQYVIIVVLGDVMWLNSALASGVIVCLHNP